MSIRLEHGKIRLALHPLREASGRALLLLHALGERSPAALPEELAPWPGPVLALDFTGHGDSTLPRGGGYTCEVLMGDADAALAHLGSATLVGRGLGAYVALLVAGARPRCVRGAILRDGPGLAGGGGDPSEVPALPAVAPRPGEPDAFALAELASDVRPPDYAERFAAQARRLSGLERPLCVCARERPGWLGALLEQEGVAEAGLPEALALYAAAT